MGAASVGSGGAAPPTVFSVRWQRPWLWGRATPPLQATGACGHWAARPQPLSVVADDPAFCSGRASAPGCGRVSAGPMLGGWGTVPDHPRELGCRVRQAQRWRGGGGRARRGRGVGGGAEATAPLSGECGRCVSAAAGAAAWKPLPTPVWELACGLVMKRVSNRKPADRRAGVLGPPRTLVGPPHAEWAAGLGSGASATPTPAGCAGWRRAGGALRAVRWPCPAGCQQRPWSLRRGCRPASALVPLNLRHCHTSPLR